MGDCKIFYWNPPVYRHKEDLTSTPVILGSDEYCNYGACIAQPVIRLGKLCIAYGEAKRSWIECFEEVK